MSEPTVPPSPDLGKDTANAALSDVIQHYLRATTTMSWAWQTLDDLLTEPGGVDAAGVARVRDRLRDRCRGLEREAQMIARYHGF